MFHNNVDSKDEHVDLKKRKNWAMVHSYFFKLTRKTSNRENLSFVLIFLLIHRDS